MKQFGKFAAIISSSATLLILGVIPTFATTYYSTGSYSTATKTFYPTGYYSTRPGYSNPTAPTLPKVTPQPVPTPKPTVPTPTPAPAKPTTPAPTTPSAPSAGLSADESKMVNLVNQARMGQGIRPLSVNMQLVSIARLKSQDMVTHNYFSHTSPTYGSPFDMMHKAGVQFTTAGENIAGAATTDSAFQSLMNSPGHRANILNTAFNQIGIGIVSGSAYGNIFTQEFIGN